MLLEQVRIAWPVLGYFMVARCKVENCGMTMCAWSSCLQREVTYGKRPGAALDLYVLIAYQIGCLGSFSLLNTSKQGQATDVRQALELLFTAVQNVQDVTT